MGGSRTSGKIKETGSWGRIIQKLTGRGKEKVKNDRLNNTKPSNDLLGELKIAKPQLFPPNMVENIFRSIASSDENRLETSALTPSAVFAVTTVSQLQEPIFWSTLSRCRTLKAMEDQNGGKRILEETLEEHCRLGGSRSPFLTLHTELISAFAEAKALAIHNPNMRPYILAVDLNKLRAEDYVSIAHLHRVLRPSLGYDNSTMIFHGERFQNKAVAWGSVPGYAIVFTLPWSGIRRSDICQTWFTVLGQENNVTPSQIEAEWQEMNYLFINPGIEVPEMIHYLKITFQMSGSDEITIGIISTFVAWAKGLVSNSSHSSEHIQRAVRKEIDEALGLLEATKHLVDYIPPPATASAGTSIVFGTLKSDSTRALTPQSQVQRVLGDRVERRVDPRSSPMSALRPAV